MADAKQNPQLQHTAEGYPYYGPPEAPPSPQVAPSKQPITGWDLISTPEGRSRLLDAIEQQPGRIARGVMDAFKYPGDVYSGAKPMPQTFDPRANDPYATEAIGKSLAIAGFVNGPIEAGPSPAFTASSLVERLQHKTVDLAKERPEGEQPEEQPATPPVGQTGNDTASDFTFHDDTRAADDSISQVLRRADAALAAAPHRPGGLPVGAPQYREGGLPPAEAQPPTMADVGQRIYDNLVGVARDAGAAVNWLGELSRNTAKAVYMNPYPERGGPLAPISEAIAPNATKKIVQTINSPEANAALSTTGVFPLMAMGTAALKGAQVSSEAGMPSLFARSGETGRPMTNSSGVAPPSTQPEPGLQVSTRPPPVGSSTTRPTTPSPRYEGPVTTFTDFKLGSIDGASNKYIVQGTNDVNALLARATENKPLLEQELTRLAAEVPGTSFESARVKDAAGMAEKITAKGRPPSTISDYLGGRVVADTPEAMRAYVDKLESTGAVIEAENFVGEGKDGYRAFHVQVGLGDGTSAEVQIVPRPIADVQSEMHAIRQPLKRLDLSDPAQLQKYKEGMAQAKQVAADAWAKASPEWKNFTYEAPQVRQQSAQPGTSFVSPNRGYLDLPSAEIELNGPRQRAFRTASEGVDHALGLRSATADAVGAWTDGAENTVVSLYPKARWSDLVSAGAMKGWLGDQKSVLVFQQGEGDAFLASFRAGTTDLEGLNRDLLKAGIENHTLVPDKNGDTTVYVLGFDQGALDGVSNFVHQNNYTEPKVRYGHGEFIGTQLSDAEAGDALQRLDAKRAYEATISDASRNDGGRTGRVWDGVRAQYGQSVAARSPVDLAVEGGPDKATVAEWQRFLRDKLPREYKDSALAKALDAEQQDATLSRANVHDLTNTNVDQRTFVDTGDKWNKSTSRRLAREYGAAKEDLNKIEEDTRQNGGQATNEDYYGPPESWDEMSGDQQAATEKAWNKNNYDAFYQSEVDHYYESGQALDDAKYQLAEGYTDPNFKEDWVHDYYAERADEGLPPIPFSEQDLTDALKVSYDQGYEGANDPTVEFDDSALKNPTSEHFKHPTLPGIEPPKPEDALTKEMRDDIVKRFTEAFNDKADSIQGDMEPSDYLGESVQDYMDSYWSEMSDKQKFQEAQDQGVVEDNAGSTEEVRVPRRFDPLDTSGGQDYADTQRFARHMFKQRAEEIIAQRKIKDTRGGPVHSAYINAADNEMWREWKGSSTSKGGALIQVASADELGGRIRHDANSNLNKQKLIDYANKEYRSIGGYEGVKALMRAKWETTQYMLDKAGVTTLQLYRGIMLPDLSLEKVGDVLTGSVKDTKTGNLFKLEVVNGYKHFPSVSIIRNGAASTTTDLSVANNWHGSLAGRGKLTLRAEVPRTAVLSVPAYGQNVHSEHEVIVVGTSWNGWDAWWGKAPSLQDVPLNAKPPSITEIGTKKFKNEMSWMSEAH